MTLRESPFHEDDFRTMGYKAVDLIADYLATIRARPVYQPMPDEKRERLLDLTFPDQGQEIDALIDQFAETILPFPMGNGHPRFFGWVNSPPDPAGIIAELLAAALDPSCAGGDHAAIYLERAVTRWLAELVGFPLESGMGLLVSGGSMASLTAIATARHAAAAQDGWNDRKDGLQHTHAPMVMYLSTEGHTTMVKAAELLGIGSSHVQWVPTDEHFQMDVKALRRMIREDREAGFRPFLVAGSAGTVSTGAVDPLDAIADVCMEEGLWFHIDGAYGAVGVMDTRSAEMFAGMERADSLALDPHKWLSVPVECGCVLVRDAGIMRDTFSLVPAYLRTEEQRGIGGLPWFSEYGFQQTRGFRALKVWMTLSATGKDGLAETIRRHNDLAKTLAGMVEATPELELFAQPTLSIVCFRVKATAGTDSDDYNKRIMEAVQSAGRAFVTQASLNSAFWLRANVLHFGTTEDDLLALISAVLHSAHRLSPTGTAT
jgi:glutamate/tyrosine decarboxylase-like PLP-dependent enzyme